MGFKQKIVCIGAGYVGGETRVLPDAMLSRPRRLLYARLPRAAVASNRSAVLNRRSDNDDDCCKMPGECTGARPSAQIAACLLAPPFAPRVCCDSRESSKSIAGARGPTPLNVQLHDLHLLEAHVKSASVLSLSANALSDTTAA